MTDSNAAASHALRDATARLAAVQAEIIALTSRAEGEWRRKLVALRRSLQLNIGEIAELIETALGDREEISQLRAALSRMRTNVALHQANWPAVAIDRDDPDYKVSVHEVRAASRDFIALVATVGSKPTSL